MTAQMSVYGRLVADPQEKQTQSGKAMTTGKMAVTLPAKNGERTLWLSLVAFGKQAELLARHKKGDMIRASGNMTANVWTDSAGVERESYQIMLDALISPRTVRPLNKSEQQGQAENALQRAREQAQAHQQPQSDDNPPPFYDEVPF